MARDRIELVLYHDVLCGFCWVAERRLVLLKEELGDAVRIEHRPFGTLPEGETLGPRERKNRARDLRLAGKEKEGAGITGALWSGDDPPRSSLPPLCALEAARIVGGNGGKARMLEALRQAALGSGVNVARTDVLLEVAHRVDLDVSRFSAALSSPETERMIVDAQEDAASHGVRAVPSLTIGEEWLVSGVRSIDEYRDTIRRYVSHRGLLVPARTLH